MLWINMASGHPKVNGTPQNLTQDEVQKLSKDPKNVMYEYQFDTVDHVKSVIEVDYLFRETLQLATKYRRDHPDHCDKRSRQDLMKKQNIADFSKTHPFLFKIATDRNSTQKDLDMAYTQLNVRANVEAGHITQEMATAHMTKYILEQCKRPDAPLPK